MKRNTIWLPIIIFVAAFLLGWLIGIPGFPLEGIEGNISKANKFRSNVISAQSELIAEKIQSDTQFAQQTLTSLSLVSVRANEFKTIVDLASKASSVIEPLKEAHLPMEGLRPISENASFNSSVALIAVRAALEGKDVELEQPLNKALLSYMLLNNSNATVKKWVEASTSFLKGKDINKYSDLAFAIDQWKSYCALEAALNSDSDELSYWSSLESLLNEEQIGHALAAMQNTQRLNIVTSRQVLNMVLNQNELGDNHKLSFGGCGLEFGGCGLELAEMGAYLGISSSENLIENASQALGIDVSKELQNAFPKTFGNIIGNSVSEVMKNLSAEELSLFSNAIKKELGNAENVDFLNAASVAEYLKNSDAKTLNKLQNLEKELLDANVSSESLSSVKGILQLITNATTSGILQARGGSDGPKIHPLKHTAEALYSTIEQTLNLSGAELGTLSDYLGNSATIGFRTLNSTKNSASISEQIISNINALNLLGRPL